MGPKLYSALIVASIVATLSAIVLTVWWVPPFIGDLTRIGGFSESDFGWNQPQQGFGRPLYRYTRNYQDLLASPSTVVVFGDSFSAPRGDGVGTWADFLANRIDESVTVFHYQTTQQLATFIDSESFRANPPAAIILQNVTRNFVWQIALPDCHLADDLPRSREHGLLPRQGQLAQATTRRTAYRDLREALSVSSYFLRAAGWNAVVPVGQVRQSDLARDDLFSSRASGRLLTYVADSASLAATPQDIARSLCTLRTLQAKATANGRTRFLFVPTPDKSLAYREYVTDEPMPVPPAYAALRETPDLEWIDSLAILDGLIGQGTKDVYLPNDTHFGSPAAAAVGEAVLSALTPRNTAPLADRAALTRRLESAD